MAVLTSVCLAAVVGRPSPTLTLSLGRQVMCLFHIGSYELFSHAGVAAMQMASCPGAAVST